MAYINSLYLLNDKKTLINIYKINCIVNNEDGTGTIYLDNPNIIINNVSKGDIITIAKSSSDNIKTCRLCGEMIPTTIYKHNADRICEECNIKQYLLDDLNYGSNTNEDDETKIKKFYDRYLIHCEENKITPLSLDKIYELLDKARSKWITNYSEQHLN